MRLRTRQEIAEEFRIPVSGVDPRMAELGVAAYAPSKKGRGYALALKLKCPDVDAMLDNMTIMQFMEWQAFFRIREEGRGKDKGQPLGMMPGGTAQPQNEKLLHAKITGGFDAAMRRRQKATVQGR